MADRAGRTSSPTLSRVAVPGDGLLHPAILGALALLLLNDHVLKAAMPGPLTGKLSDLAGLAFFPMLLTAAWELARAAAGRWHGPSPASVGIAAAATAVVFSIAKTTPAGAAGLGWAIGAAQWLGTAPVRLLAGSPMPLSAARVVMDPTDLLALPAVVIPLLVAVRRCRGAAVVPNRQPTRAPEPSP